MGTVAVVFAWLLVVAIVLCVAGAMLAGRIVRAVDFGVCVALLLAAWLVVRWIVLH